MDYWSVVGVADLVHTVEHDLRLLRYDLERWRWSHRGGADVARDLAPHIVPAVLTEQVAPLTLIPLATVVGFPSGTM